jgi:type IV pilus assembly protein PilM
MMFGWVILGLDVGSYSVKAAELRAGLREVEFARFEEEVFSPNATAEEREFTLRVFLESRGLPVELVIAAIPSHRGTQRHLRFPFTDSRKITQAIPFEIEEAIPIPLDEVIVSHDLVRSRGEESSVLAVLAPRNDIGTHLNDLRAAGVEPRVLEMEGTVLANLAQYVGLTAGNRMILDIGHRKTNACLMVDGAPALVRSIPIAGAHLTEALARDLQIDRDAAEQQKHESGLFEASGTKPIYPSVGTELDRLAREVLRTVQSIISELRPEFAPTGVVLVGGSAAIPGLDAFLTEKVGLSCEVMHIGPIDQSRSKLVAAGPERFAQAAGLALRGAPPTRATRVDFRQGEFKYTPDLSDLRRGLRPTAVLAALLLLLWIGSLVVRVVDTGRRGDALRDQVQVVYQKGFRNTTPTGDPIEAIETRVREIRDLANHLGVTGHSLSPLEILREIGTRMPQQDDVGLTDLQIERYSVQARGYAPSFETVDQIRAKLSQVKMFGDVRLSDVLTDAKSGGKTFRLTIRVQEET